MKSTIYPFLENKKGFTKDSVIIKEGLSFIEYDLEIILKTLNNEDPTRDFSYFNKINRNQLIDVLRVVTTNIVEINCENSNS